MFTKMPPIHEVINRIYRDPEFGRGYFEIGYCGRMEKEIIRGSFNEVTQMPGNKFSFHVFDDEGIAHCVTMDRVKKVYKDGELIWKCDLESA
jgi:uncharacterized protein (UPF0248 family)